MCFGVFGIIRFLKQNRYSSDIIKLVNNSDVTYVTFDCLKIGHTMHWLTIIELQCKFYRVGGKALQK